MIKSFRLGARKYRVHVVEHDADIDYIGLARPATGEIEILASYQGRLIPEDAQEQTLYHEVVHCIFEEIGRRDLFEDETLVQSFAALLHQFERSKK